MNPDSIAPGLKKAYRWLIAWSVVVFVCGILAIILPLTFSFAIAFFIGSLAVIAGIAHFVFAFHGRNLGGFALHMLLGALYEIAAICLLVNPLLSVLSLPLILAIFLLLEGVLELALYVRLRQYHRSVWLIIDGIGTLILGMVMIRQWPPHSPEIIGVLIGISLMLSAGSRLILLTAIRELTPDSAQQIFTSSTDG